jgi:NAD(P)-dependent dehydrogenase (short-subunit alcohol dehydrogenase family)
MTPRLASALSGRSAVVIGAETQVFHSASAALRAAGAQVRMIIDSPQDGLSPPDAISNRDPIADVWRLDLTSLDSTACLAAKLCKDAAAPDILCLVPSAPALGRAADATTHSWDQHLHEPLRKVTHVLAAFLPSLRAREGTPHVVALIGVEGVVPAPQFGVSTVFARALLGLFESLRAELHTTNVGVSAVLFDQKSDSKRLGQSLVQAVVDNDLYAFTIDRMEERIYAYFKPLLASIDQTPAGTPLPDVGPMGAVYLPEQRSNRSS